MQANLPEELVHLMPEVSCDDPCIDHQLLRYVAHKCDIPFEVALKVLLQLWFGWNGLKVVDVVWEDLAFCFLASPYIAQNPIP